MARFVSSTAAIGFILITIASAQVRPGQCGSDRWTVKILDDRDAGSVDFKPIDATISELARRRIHEIRYPDNARIAPEELRVYRIKATLVATKNESDGDLHVIVADPGQPTVTMVVEIPSPRCAP